MDTASADIVTPFDESSRLAALHALALLDSGPEAEFDALVALAAELLGCPTALFNLVDRNRLWIKASTVPMPDEIGRDIAICDHTIRGSDPLVVEDFRDDPRFRDNPLVTEGGFRFYAGTPVHAAGADGVRHPVGTLCVIGETPRSLNPAGHAALRHLASIAEALIEAQRVASRAIEIATTGESLVARLAHKDRVFRQAERIAMIGSWRLTLADQSLEWSDNVYRIHGLPPGQQPTLENALDFYPPHAREGLGRALGHSMRTGAPFEIEDDFVTADGRMRRVRSMGEAEWKDGQVVALVGIFQDITDRHALEQQLRRSADTDALTGIANRSRFDREIERAMAAARRDRTPLLLALVDLDGFKAINDTLGHGAGDDVLRMTGAALSQPWLAGSLCARIGGDEFALIVDDPALVADPEELRRRITDALHLTVEAGGVTMASSGSVGVARFDDDCRSMRDFARRADQMLYAVKGARIGARRASDRERRAA